MRFIAPMPRLRRDGATWRADLLRIEALGFDTVAVSHHLANGWQLGLTSAMAYAAASTSRLRVLSLVAQNDLQHPALLAKDIATIDVLSGGRVELGLGAGWDPADHAAIGSTMDSASRRIARLEEALQIVRAYFTGDTVDFSGDHYRVEELEALPRCVQQPGPPILVGGGGPRMLALAGRHADIVGIHPPMTAGRIGPDAVAELAATSIEEKVAVVRDAARAAGRPDPELQFSCYHVRVDEAEPAAPRPGWDAMIGANRDLLRDSPVSLVGTAAECAAQLAEWRERFGISYWHLGPDVEAAARILDHIG